MRAILLGGHGMLGHDIASELRGSDVVTPSASELDVRDLGALRRECRRVRPDFLISTVAFHRVDDSESQPDAAFTMNAVATRNLATAAHDAGATLVWVSTDYLFDGERTEPYQVDDRPLPLQVYGVSKLAGEHVIRLTAPDHLIVRTSGLYGLHRPVVQRVNFADKVLRHARMGRSRISVPADQVCTPTYTSDLAEVIVRLMHSGERGTFHATNSGECSWAEFAEAVLEMIDASTKVERTTAKEYPMVARRPAYSVLSLDALAKVGVPQPRPWREALRDFLAARISAGAGPV
jgi:dTDP-4-dehydrorhamnose reductase